MGCGGSVETHTKPLETPPQNNQQLEEETPKPSTLQPIAEEHDEGKATDSPKNKKKPMDSSRVSQKSTGKGGKSNEKGSKASPGKGSPGKGDGPKGLRNSSLRSSRAGSSSKKKLNNPEGGLGATEAIEEEDLKPITQKPSQKTIKKVKSVKNNKDLSDLIKVYGM